MTRHGKATTRLGRMMKCYRMVDDLSLRDLAKQIGTSAATVLRIEQGYEVDQRTFLRVVNWMVTR